ncbi:MAG: hypothetical protein GY777_09955 [Candidatus Brocadiaceae bacterium]|nr:hypothetical protein [Candidatus Brocadiaceae bacterium]
MKSLTKYILKKSSLIQAKRQLQIIKERDESLFNNSYQSGFVRGVDYYDDEKLLKAVSMSFFSYFNAHGYFPNIAHPKTFNEKIVWSKFFRQFKVPESGNKLLTTHFIPDDLKNIIQTPEVIWHSVSNILPQNDEIEPSDYYLKSSHGSNFVRRVSFPLSDDERSALEKRGKKWLRKRFGLDNGEWWYNTFQPELLLERAVTSVENSISWNIYVFQDQIPFVAAYKKLSNPKRSNRYDGNLKLLPFQNPEIDRIPDSFIDKDYVRSELLPLAKKIAASHDFLRVDLFVGKDGVPYLNEITFSPVNAKMKLPPDFDLYLGNYWKL